MDNRPIGFLDSGVGGLTVVRELMRQLPHEEIVYILRILLEHRTVLDLLNRFANTLGNWLISLDTKMLR